MGSQPTIDTEMMLDDLRSLVRIHSALPCEESLARFIAERVRQMGVEPRIDPVAPGRPNVYATIDFGGSGPFLVFSGHSDTVPATPGWETDPLMPVEREGRLYGLGAINMKGGLACMLAAFRCLAGQGPSSALCGRIGLAVTVDQEGESMGARRLLATEFGGCDAMLHAEHFFGDSPRDYLPSGATGKVNVQVLLRGQAAHAFRPKEGGINAIDDAAALIDALSRMKLGEHPDFGSATLCTLKIEGGYKQYAMVVPDRCEFMATRLLVPGEDRESAVKDLDQLARSLPLQSEVTIRTPPPYYEPYRIDTDSAFVRTFQEAYQETVGVAPTFAPHRGVVDANVFVAEGKIPTVVFGPKGANHHQPGEYVELRTLLPVARVYVKTALAYLSGGAGFYESGPVVKCTFPYFCAASSRGTNVQTCQASIRALGSQCPARRVTEGATGRFGEGWLNLVERASRASPHPSSTSSRRLGQLSTQLPRRLLPFRLAGSYRTTPRARFTS